MKFWGVLYIDFWVGFIFKLYCIIGLNFIIFVLIVYLGMFENFKDLNIEYEL